jgi:hypothetical protein
VIQLATFVLVYSGITASPSRWPECRPKHVGENNVNKLLSFNRTQSRAVIGLLTGHNTLRRHLHIMGLSDNPICRKCGTGEEICVHILCECEALDSLRHT